MCKSNNGNYLISESSSGILTYHKTITECAEFTNSSRSTIMKHPNITKANPFIVKKSNYKIYFSNDFIPFIDTAVPIEKSSELLESNIGENLEIENPEIND